MAECPTLWGDVNQAPPIEPVEVTTDHLVAEAHANRAGLEYPTVEQAIANLPVVLRALCDHLLEVHPDAMDVARRLASIIEAVEHVQGGPTEQKEPLP